MPRRKTPVMEIWHAKEPNFGLGPDPKWPADYRKVATVKGACLGLAYARTQHVETPWYENSEVKLLVRQETVRSTAVGDVAVVRGVPHRYTTSGWCEIAD